MDILPTLLVTFGFALLGYLCGSLPFAIWITRLFNGVDVRDAGSGHAAA
jgi:glycerol-3-phosphate acyltransferase PlsY